MRMKLFCDVATATIDTEDAPAATENVAPSPAKRKSWTLFSISLAVGALVGGTLIGGSMAVGGRQPLLKERFAEDGAAGRASENKRDLAPSTGHRRLSVAVATSDSCENHGDCANIQKCAGKPHRCKCKDRKCRKKKKDCATRGDEMEWWGCRDGEECIAQVKDDDKTWKWGKCMPTGWPNQCLSSMEVASSLDQDLDCADMPSSIEAIALTLLENDSGSAFQGSILEADDAGYEASRLQYASPNVDTSPTYIVEARGVVDVQAVVIFAAACGYPATTRSGGHSYLGISSCDGASGKPCIQLDVGGLNGTEVVPPTEHRGKQLRIGPGVHLWQLDDLFVQEEVFVPTGECDSIAMGGHVQTGGFGVWGRSFGAFSHWVASFAIVLSDGTPARAERPRAGVTSPLNDDLFYAVLGGASGSFGTIVEITLDTIDEREYFSFFWEVNFLWNDDTLPGIKGMLRKLAEIMAGKQDDPRWNTFINFIGAKTALQLNNAWPSGLECNYVQLDLSWVAAKAPGVEESDEFSDAQAFYDDLVGACVGCFLLDDFLGPLSVAIPSAYAVSAPVSQLHRDIAVTNWDSVGVNGLPYKSSFQQGPEFPSADAIAEIVDGVDQLAPKENTDMRFLISQIATAPGPRFRDPKISLPFQDDVYGVALDVWDFTGAIDYGPPLRAVQDKVISALGGVDHRMFWGAYEDPCLECGDWEKYYESEDKYNNLREIKTCVDPDNVFNNSMSLLPKEVTNRRNTKSYASRD